MEEKKGPYALTIEKTGPYQFKIQFPDDKPITWTFYKPNITDPDIDLSLEAFARMLREMLWYCAKSLSITWTPDGIKWESKLPKSIDDIFPKDN